MHVYSVSLYHRDAGSIQNGMGKLDIKVEIEAYLVYMLCSFCRMAVGLLDLSQAEKEMIVC